MSAHGMKITNFHYSNMSMPKLDPTEYPKWVYMDGYPGELVEDAEKEAELLSRPVKVKDDKPIVIQPPVPAAPAAAPTQVLTGPNDEKKILLQIAKEKNITVDARWNITRIRATLEREAP